MEFARMAFSQAWQVTALVVFVLLATRLVARNRPHLAYMLWLVVLIKCVTPPLWSSPSSAFSWLQTALVNQSSQSVADHVLQGPLVGSDYEITEHSSSGPDDVEIQVHPYDVPVTEELSTLQVVEEERYLAPAGLLLVSRLGRRLRTGAACKWWPMVALRLEAADDCIRAGQRVRRSDCRAFRTTQGAMARPIARDNKPRGARCHRVVSTFDRIAGHRCSRQTTRRAGSDPRPRTDSCSPRRPLAWLATGLCEGGVVVLSVGVVGEPSDDARSGTMLR